MIQHGVFRAGHAMIAEKEYSVALLEAFHHAKRFRRTADKRRTSWPITNFQIGHMVMRVVDDNLVGAPV